MKKEEEKVLSGAENFTAEDLVKDGILVRAEAGMSDRFGMMYKYEYAQWIKEHMLSEEERILAKAEKILEKRKNEKEKTK